MYDDASARDTRDSDARKSGSDGQALPFVGGIAPIEGEHVNIYDMLRELEELPERARKVFGKSVLVGFDHERFCHLVLKIRANLPQDVKQARRVTREQGKIVESARYEGDQIVERCREEAQRIVASGKAEANHIIEAAQSEAARMVDESEVMRMAHAQAREALHQAETEADDIRRGANDYARDVLANMEQIMGQALGTIQRGRQTLEDATGVG